MKKLFKWLFILIFIFAVIIAGAGFVAYKAYPPAKLKVMAQDYVKDNFKREIEFDSLSFNFIGVNLKGFKLSESGGFSKGTFVASDKAVVKIAVKPLFDKKLQVKRVGLEGITINVLKDKNGRFNFDDLTQLGGDTPKQTQTASAPMDIDFVVDKIYIKDATLNYTDKQGGMAFSVRGFNFNINKFNLNNPFDFDGSFMTDVKLPDIKLSSVKFSFAGTGNLAGMVMKNASLQLNNFDAAYKSFKASVGGKVSNFDNPAADLKGFITGVDNKLAQEFVSEPLPAFALPKINLALSTITNIDKNTTKINEAKISLGNSYVRTTADIDYSAQDLKYGSNTKLAVSLKEVADMAKETLAAFKLAGDISGEVAASSGKDLPNVKGSITFKNIGAVVKDKQLKDLSGVITIASLNDIKTNLIKGNFDNSPLSTSLSYTKPAQVMNIDFFFDMDKFTLDDIDFDAYLPKNQPKADKNAPKPQNEPIVCQTCERTPPMNIKADITIRKISNNILDTNNLKLKVDIKDFDNRFDKAAGTITFSTENGEIRDIKKLMQSSVFFKIALTSLSVIQKAFGALKLDSSTLTANKITYSLISGAFALKNGITTINKMDVNSDLTTVKTTGTVNLLTEKLDMKVESHIGKMGSSGFKPVVIKIGGTINDPSYKLDVASTLSSVLGSSSSGGSTSATAKETAANAKESASNAVSNAKDVLKGVLKK